jgi:hypothetical protein
MKLPVENELRLASSQSVITFHRGSQRIAAVLALVARIKGLF